MHHLGGYVYNMHHLDGYVYNMHLPVYLPVYNIHLPDITMFTTYTFPALLCLQHTPNRHLYVYNSPPWHYHVCVYNIRYTLPRHYYVYNLHLPDITMFTIHAFLALLCLQQTPPWHYYFYNIYLPCITMLTTHASLALLSLYNPSPRGNK